MHEEEASAKAYESRLMRRLLQYMKPYKWRVVLALVMVAIVTPLELARRSSSKCHRQLFRSGLNHLLPEAPPGTGIGWLSLIFCRLGLRLPRQYIQIAHAARRQQDHV